MTPTAIHAARTIALPALAASALALGLALGPVAALAAAAVGDPDAAGPAPAELVADLQLETLAPEGTAPLAADSEPSGPSAEFTATTARVIGTVTRTDGTPIAGAVVVYQLVGSADGSDVVVTDATGEYATPELAPGEYLLVYASDGYVMRSETALLGAGSDLELSVELAAKPRLVVSVVFADDSPAVGHRVAVYPGDPGPVTVSDLTDPAGQVMILLDPGAFRVEVQDPAGASLGWYDGDPSLSAAALPLTAVAESPTITLQIVLDGTGATGDGTTGDGTTGGGATGPGIPDPADSCENPLTGQPEPCDPEQCLSATGLPVACDAPECEYRCDEPIRPHSSTVPEHTVPDTELETLAHTGAEAHGLALVAGASLLLGAGALVAARLQRRRQTS